MNRKSRGLVLIGISAAVFGFEPIFAKLCYQTGFSVSSLLLFRYVFAIVLLVIFARIAGQPLILKGKYLKFGIIMGVLGSLNIGLLFKAYELLPTAVAVPIFYIYPTLTSVWARVLYKTRISKIRIAAIVVCLLGMGLLYQASFALNLNFWGILFDLISAVIMSYLIIMLERYMPEVNETTYLLTLFYVNALVFLILNFINQNIFTLGQVQPLGWGYLILLVIIPTITSNIFMCYGMNTAPAVDASILNVLEIPFAAIYAFFMFGDLLNGWQILGAIFIMIAAITPPFTAKYQRRKKQKGSTIIDP